MTEELARARDLKRKEEIKMSRKEKKKGKPRTYRCFRCGATITVGDEFCLGCGRLTILDEVGGFEDYDAIADEED